MGGTIGFNLDHLLPDSLFVNDKKVAEINAQAQYGIAQQQTAAELEAKKNHDKTLLMIAGVIGFLILLAVIAAVALRK